MNNNSLKNCKIIPLNRNDDTRGSIISPNFSREIPFNVKRIFYIYDIPFGKSRGAHAHKECHQMLIAVTGSFEVELFDGKSKQTFFLNQPNQGLHITPGIWGSEKNFSSGAICLVLNSDFFSESDYIRDYNKFLECVDIKNIKQ